MLTPSEITTRGDRLWKELSLKLGSEKSLIVFLHQTPREEVKTTFGIKNSEYLMLTLVKEAKCDEYIPS